MGRITKIISGGQTGADRGALDAAIELGIPHGGWCPLERRSEDGIIPSKYNLTETNSSLYEDRTSQNVSDSDATLILYYDTLDKGTNFTIDVARKLNRPFCAINLSDDSALSAFESWLESLPMQNITLNIAGPRESNSPGVHDAVYSFLLQVLP